MNEVEMDAKVALKATSREQRGSVAARRLRRAGELPANITGLGKEPRAVTVPAREFNAVRRSRAQLIPIDLEGEQLEVIVRELQLDTFGDHVLHVDFEEVRRGETLELEIPIDIVGEAAGAADGGVLEVKMDSVNVSCLPSAIPERIVVEVDRLEIDEEIRLRDLVLPEGVTLAEDQDEDEIIVLVSTPVGAEEEEEEAEDLEPAEAGSEPEVIHRGKEEEEDKD